MAYKNSRQQYRRRNSNRYNGRNSSFEAAKKHIEEAEALSEELGGTDRDVKEWFFSLEGEQLEEIFVAYGSEYGNSKLEYARVAFQDWRLGKKKMSGMVAERLFKLLPPYMPLETKYSLVESLWDFVGPKTKRVITAGRQSSIDDILEEVDKEIRSLTTNWMIPTPLTKRFTWLSSNDSEVYQKLLSHLKDQERELGEKTIKQQLPELKEKFETDLSENASRLSYVIDVGRQSVEVRLTGDQNEIKSSNWFPAPRPEPLKQPKSGSSDDFVALKWIGVGVVIACLIAMFG
ncbi:MAG: hypothetical protein DSY85_09265 [Marinomonas sp.]|nr:MAG: hypothetical protein DSY85_09265 [Marinomonas sp.]